MIDISKKYRTADGRKVEIYGIKEGQDYPVLGAIEDSEGGAWKPASWTPHGLYIEGKPYGHDLVEIRPRIKRTVWLNIYAGRVSSPYGNKADADRWRDSDCIACVKVEIDCEEGEGL